RELEETSESVWVMFNNNGRSTDVATGGEIAQAPVNALTMKEMLAKHTAAPEAGGVPGRLEGGEHRGAPPRRDRVPRTVVRGCQSGEGVCDRSLSWPSSSRATVASPGWGRIGLTWELRVYRARAGEIRCRTATPAMQIRPPETTEVSTVVRRATAPDS